MTPKEFLIERTRLKTVALKGIREEHKMILQELISVRTRVDELYRKYEELLEDTKELILLE